MAAVIIQGNSGNVIAVYEGLAAVGRVYGTEPGTVGSDGSVICICGICACVSKGNSNLSYGTVILPAAFNRKRIADYGIVARA